MIFDKMKCCIIKLLGGYTAEEFIHCAMFHPDDTVGKRVQELIQIIRMQQKIIDTVLSKISYSEQEDSK